MREGDDVRDIYWRKSINQIVVRERAREAEQECRLTLDDQTPTLPASDKWLQAFEQRIREVASRAVAHLKRGDRVSVRTLSGEVLRVDGAVGADPLLRFLALLEPRAAADLRRSSAPPAESTAVKAGAAGDDPALKDTGT
jgi:uncharacterized protein (DUF58 family)